ncbi:4-hydroxythreonine-4-phosphate dehydrogenase PdxA [Fulvivirgaceae bacterium PWU4]|uniref:4-hydroxythreonine-4-phosphate dehydrogenase PdxA n=1 Tax=Chryseosolibacter histidini TaxID=2782349 RepID=A0AAP2GKS8_9BACT|nr:4-hydroxythreonine-4-phosphate dehydrogenase PdxA [Chryseosolibacter histidini]MBT1699369.1 4-hydroxythreonine-4-phosphate dehydrogenase PdxA [Chryseosolibacter histidini]
MTPSKPRIGITVGDLNGIGPEVVIKALADNRLLNMVTPVLYGSSRVVSFYKKLLNIEELNYAQVKSKGQFAHKAVNVVNCWEDNFEITPGKPSRESGKAAFTALKWACEELKEGLLDALVTSPIDKNTIHSSEFPFKGHTEFLTQFFGAGESLMFMVSDAIKVGLVTEHVPLAEVSKLITKERLLAKLSVMEASLKKDFGINKPRIAVLGLNPHAGDGGLIGQEDDQVIKPVVNDLRNKGKLVFGPFPSDGFFGMAQYTRYDGVMAMYHDQGLIPFKSIAFENGINFTAGLSVVRTSPDHGTAYSIAGKNQANEGSIREAIYRAGDIFRHRTEPSTEK